ncbi:MAG TPA: OmpH family outer membrane protein [Polyangiaceae bacterium]
MALPRTLHTLVPSLLAGLVLVAPALALAEQKIAVVDTQRAVMETEDGMRAQATLKKVFDNKQRELDKKQEDLQKEREDIEKQRNVLSAEAWQKRVESWQRDMAQLQSIFLEYNKELQKKQGELTEPIFRRTVGVIRRLATTEGYDMVVDKQAVPYVRGDLDVTDRVIQLVNSGSGADEAKADPKKGAKGGKAAAAPGAAAPAPLPVPAMPAPAPAPAGK